jgi:hypothetical protein
MGDAGHAVDLPGADPELTADIERRIAEFEAAHEAVLMRLFVLPARDAVQRGVSTTRPATRAA